MTAATRVMLVDDHPMWIEALGADLMAEGFEIVAVASTGDECLRRARAARPDVLVMDLRIPEPDGATCIEVLLVRESGASAAAGAMPPALCCRIMPIGPA